MQRMSRLYIIFEERRYEILDCVATGFCVRGVFLERRAECVHLRTSVIVPCHHRHFVLLEGLFAAYAEQTRVPDEVVVAVSEWGRVDPGVVERVEGREWPFLVVWVRQKGRAPPGRNRNDACAASSGDLLICQDADDLPHPQRVEVIAKLFEENELDHLLHYWLPEEGVFSPVDVGGLMGESVRVFALIAEEPIHNGSASFLRGVFEQVRWRASFEIGEDYAFNRMAYAFFSE